MKQLFVKLIVLAVCLPGLLVSLPAQAARPDPAVAAAAVNDFPRTISALPDYFYLPQSPVSCGYLINTGKRFFLRLEGENLCREIQYLAQFSARKACLNGLLLNVVATTYRPWPQARRDVLNIMGYCRTIVIPGKHFAE